MSSCPVATKKGREVRCQLSRASTRRYPLSFSVAFPFTQCRSYCLGRCNLVPQSTSAYRLDQRLKGRDGEAKRNNESTAPHLFGCPCAYETSIASIAGILPRLEIFRPHQREQAAVAPHPGHYSRAVAGVISQAMRLRSCDVNCDMEKIAMGVVTWSCGAFNGRSDEFPRRWVANCTRDKRDAICNAVRDLRGYGSPQASG
jgi:hypothetical protein